MHAKRKSAPIAQSGRRALSRRFIKFGGRANRHCILARSGPRRDQEVSRRGPERHRSETHTARLIPRPKHAADACQTARGSSPLLALLVGNIAHQRLRSMLSYRYEIARKPRAGQKEFQIRHRPAMRRSRWPMSKPCSAGPRTSGVTLAVPGGPTWLQIRNQSEATSVPRDGDLAAQPQRPSVRLKLLAAFLFWAQSGFFEARPNSSKFCDFAQAYAGLAALSLVLAVFARQSCASAFAARRVYFLSEL